MAGHSQFKNIQYRKGAQDAKRANVFAKLSRKISVAAKEGGIDPSMNSKLRSIIDEARCMNMPRDKIDLAIKKNIGTLSPELYEYAIYEVRLSSIGVMIEALTNNRNRTASEIKKVLKGFDDFHDFGGASFLFANRGIVGYDKPSLVVSHEKFLDEILLTDLVEDIIDDEFIIACVSSTSNLIALRSMLSERYGPPLCARNIWIPYEYIEPDDKTKQKISNLINALEAMEDINTVDTNIFINF